MQLGELLVANNIITEEQLHEGLKLQATSPKKIGELLLELGYITERQLLEVLEFQLGIPSVTMIEATMEIGVAQLISENLAKKHCAIPIKRQKDKLIVAMEDPLNYSAIEEIRLATGMSLQPVIAMKSEIEQAISRHYGMDDTVEELIDEFEFDEMDDPEQEAQNQDSPIVKLVNQIIYAAVIQRVSDIHIEPQEQNVQIRYRIDGVLHNERTLPKHMQGVLTARLKILAKLNIAERRLPQDGRIQMQVEHRRIDIRVSTLPAATGESIVMRILDQSAGISKLDELGLSDNNLKLFESVIQKPNGIVLISGPTGSGKTSTLYSGLSSLNNPDVKIITVEDPVEYRMNGITQVQVNSQIGLTFASGLRSILRQDPNIVMVGEVRDTETAEIAVRASLTGHLVLSTIHTNSAIATISRLIDMGIEPYLIASSLTCVVAQRLVRRICKDCATSVPAGSDEVQLFETVGLIEPTNRQEANGHFPVVVDTDITVTKGSGCAACNQMGYRGRIAIQEVLVVDEGLRRLIVMNGSIDDMKEYLSEQRFKYMLYDGLEKVLKGITTTEEILKAVSAEE